MNNSSFKKKNVNRINSKQFQNILKHLISFDRKHTSAIFQYSAKYELRENVDCQSQERG